MILKKANKCKVGLAVYNFDWVHSTGTQTIAQELIRNILKLEQSIIEYKVLLKDNVLPERIGLPSGVCLRSPSPSYSLGAKIRRRLGRILHEKADTIRGIFGFPPKLEYLGKPWIKDWLRSLDLDLLYYPTFWQHELILDIPIVAQLYDMQHIYYPELWQHDTFQRYTVFGWYSSHACLITSNFDFTANDIKKHLKVPEERMATIFLAPPKTPSIDDAYSRAIKEEFNLPEHYFIYPAATWPSKNHINLVRALGECVAKGLEVYCVCPGEHADWLYPGQFLKIQEEARKCKVEKNIYFLGNVPHKEVYALIQQADFVCVPTLYEAGCYPIWEAFCLGKAVCASDVTMIPYQVRDVGLLFNPQDPTDIAKAIALLYKDQKLRDYLGDKARRLLDDPYYSPQKTPLGYHRAFVNSLVRLGKLSREFWIEEDPAPALDRRPWPPRFQWRELLK
jgi:glycosyltransferase involved in cell wall biosynthesis